MVVQDADFDRFPPPDYRRFVSLGFKSACSIPLVTRNRTLGILEIARTTGHPWTEYDIDLLVQVARQIAIAVENSLSYRELAEMKERLATEKLYLEDEIRFDRHVAFLARRIWRTQSPSRRDSSPGLLRSLAID